MNRDFRRAVTVVLAFNLIVWLIVVEATAHLAR